MCLLKHTNSPLVKYLGCSIAINLPVKCYCFKFECKHVFWEYNYFILESRKPGWNITGNAKMNKMQ